MEKLKVWKVNPNELKDMSQIIFAGEIELGVNKNAD